MGWVCTNCKERLQNSQPILEPLILLGTTGLLEAELPFGHRQEVEHIQVA